MIQLLSSQLVFSYGYLGALSSAALLHRSPPSPELVLLVQSAMFLNVFLWVFFFFLVFWTAFKTQAFCNLGVFLYIVKFQHTVNAN